jgi:hypothetical protein
MTIPPSMWSKLWKPNTRFIFDLERRSDKANNSTNSTYDPRKREQVLNWGLRLAVLSISRYDLTAK